MPDGFLNEAEFIAYPFIYQKTGSIPDCAVVDFGCMLFTGSGFIEGTHKIWCEWIRRLDDNIEYSFASNAPGLALKSLRFVRNINEPRFSTSYSWAQQALTMAEAENTCPGGVAAPIVPTVMPNPDVCPFNPLWVGFMVSGDMRRIVELLRACSGSGLPTILKGPADVEPSRIQNLSEAYVRSVVVLNRDRTRATPPDGCRPPYYPYPAKPYYIVCNCLDGEVRFDSGFSMNIRQDNATNSIIFDAEPGAGLGYPCEEQPLHPAEVPPQGFSTLSASLKCEEVLRSFNGIGGRNFIFSTGSGVQITADPTYNRLIVDVNMHSLALAPPPEPPVDVTYFPPSTDPHTCGPLVILPPPTTTTTSTTTPKPGTSTTTPTPGTPNVLYSDGFSLTESPYDGPSDGLGHTHAGFSGLGGLTGIRSIEHIRATPFTIGGALRMHTLGAGFPFVASRVDIDPGQPQTFITSCYVFMNVKRLALPNVAWQVKFYLDNNHFIDESFMVRIDFTANKHQLFYKNVIVSDVSLIGATQANLYIQSVGNQIRYKWGGQNVVSYTHGGVTNFPVHAVEIEGESGSPNNPFDIFDIDNLVVSKVKPTPGWPI